MMIKVTTLLISAMAVTATSQSAFAQTGGCNDAPTAIPAMPMPAPAWGQQHPQTRMAPPPAQRYDHRYPRERRWSPWRDGFDFDRRSKPWEGDYWDGKDRWGNETDWGPFEGIWDGSGAGSADFDFNISADIEFEGDGDFDGRGDGRSYHYNYWYDGYGHYPRHYYGPVPYMMAPPVHAPAPAAAAPVAPATEAPKQPEPVKTDNADDDMDGVINIADYCPDSAKGASVDAFGCEITQTIVLRGVNFLTNSDQLTDESIAILDRVSNTLNAHPELKLEVAGHTDSDGDDAYNKDLSQRRAVTVQQYLIEKGANADNLSAAGYGEEKPVAGNDTAEGKATNRRVELNRI